MRTDFMERERWRLRGRWDIAKVVHVLATAEKMNASNPVRAVAFDEETKRWGMAINVDASSKLAARFGYDLYRTDSQIVVRIPQDFTFDDSTYHEDGEAFDGGFTFHTKRFSLDTGYTQYKNGGLYAFALNRTYATCDVEFSDRIGAGLRFDMRDFNQPSLAVAEYKAKRYALVVKWHQ